MGFIFPAWRGLDLTEADKCRFAVRKRLDDGIYRPHWHPPTYPSADVRQLVVVAAFYGESRSRYEAAHKALEYIGKSDPLPRYILVECVMEGQTTRGWPPFMEVIQIPVSRKSVGIWLKESLLDIGIRKAMEDEGVDAVLLLDTDCAFCDPSWAIYVTDALSQYEIIQPALLGYTVPTVEGVIGDVRIQEDCWCKQSGRSSPLPPLFSIGLTRALWDHLKGRLPKNQNRGGDSDLMEAASYVCCRYGTAYQSLFHMEHDTLSIERCVCREYARVTGKPLNQRIAIDWEADVPVWVDTMAASIAESVWTDPEAFNNAPSSPPAILSSNQ